MPYALVLVLFVAHAGTDSAQGQVVRLRVEVRAGNGPVVGAEVIVAGVPYQTDAQGRAAITVSPGATEVTVVKEGFVPATVLAQVEAGREPLLIVELQPLPTIQEEVTVVAATRTDKRLEDQPMRVEVLARDEIEEKMMMTPGDIVMMLNEMGGLRVQATSPSLGAASIRIQGMLGRYTRVLSDGLPLFGGQVGGLGLLQIPPMDLGQVEVIKGVASALYGAGAMGGVVNLLSRRPGSEPVREALVNRSTRGATDTVLFLAAPLSPRWSASLLGSGHWQQQTDVNKDGWADLPGYARGVLRPRIFWNNGSGRSLFATAGMTYEDRHGGTMPGRTLSPAGWPYEEALDTARFDAGVLGQTLFAGRYVVTARGAAARQRHRHQFGTVQERDKHDTAFGELTVRAHSGRQTWVGGAAVEHEAYAPLDVPQFKYAFTVPGLFAQADVDLGRALSLSMSARVDVHSEFGTFFSPRISALVRSGRWTSRLSAGTGFFASTPITEETEAAGLSRLIVPRRLRAERGQSASLDLSRTDGPASYTLTLFASGIHDALHVDRTDAFVLTNLVEPTTNTGVEMLGTLRRGAIALTATYTYVRARETIERVRDDVPLTPRHSVGVVGVWDIQHKGRFGVEWYYTGRQRLEENPFRTVSKPYALVGLLLERRLGRFRLFLNGENLSGVRQTRWDPLVRPTQSADGRWTVDAWAPLDGRTINGGIRAGF